MSLPSVLDIIRKYPIGGGLDAFRDSFNSTCAELGHRVGLNALQPFNYEGLKNLAFELFLALQILPVSRYLPSSDRRRTLLRDLARLIRSVDDTDDFDVKSVVPLLEQVVKHMRPMKIYGGAVFTLVARRAAPSAVFNKAAFETPLKSTSSSQQGDEQIHDEIDPRILQENNGWVYQNTRGFYEKYFEGRTWSTVVEKIVRAVNPRIVDGRWD